MAFCTTFLLKRDQCCLCYLFWIKKWCKKPSSGSLLYTSSYTIHFQGPAWVIVSCVEENPPYRAHPHNLVGKNCVKGICKKEMEESTMTATFPGIGVQCVKRKDIPNSLEQRQKNGIDPFQQGFDHQEAVTMINLNTLRLCFQVFPAMQTRVNRMEIPIIKPIVSAVIRDKKVYR